MRTRIKNDRRGITLLFVISMIVLFLLMGTSFVILSNDYFRSARKRGRAKIHVIDQQAMAERAFYDLVRGPSLLNTKSPLRGHDILSDQYGYGFKAYVDTREVLQEGAILRLRLKGIKDKDWDVNNDGKTSVWDLRYPETLLPEGSLDQDGVPVQHLFTGNVFSFTSGASKGMSTRIVSHLYDTDDGRHDFYILLPENYDTTYLPSPDDEVVVNNRDFSGTGVGGERPDPTNPAVELGVSALSPNRSGESVEDFVVNYLDSGAHQPNEPYDAADYQNMFLSGRTGDDDEIIASFDREPLGLGKRKVFRPDSNSNYDYSIGLNVDSDNDGTRDAVFIDPGYEISTDADGVRYKPLVAYRVEDLDGRINANYHGSLAHGNQSPNDFIGVYNSLLGDGNDQNKFPRGQGYGPAEIYTNELYQLGSSPCFSDVLINAAPNQWVLPFSQRQLFGYPRGAVNWPNSVGTVNRDDAQRPGSLFASSAMDISGRFRVGSPASTATNGPNNFDNFVDPNVPTFKNGLPVIDMQTSTAGNEFNFLNPYARSKRWSPAAMEDLLRPFDIDSRVDGACEYPGGKEGQIATTESWDVPVAPRNLKTLLMTRLGTKDSNLNTKALLNERADLLIGQGLFAPELLLGLKMDVNRPFGNGYDDNLNGIVDEPAEFDEEINRDLPQSLIDAIVDGESNYDPKMYVQNARIEFARHLYMLVLLLTDPVDMDLDGDGTPDPNSYEKVLAQWVINVVDFRDPDSINTGFEFDLNPWNGWDVDNDLSTEEPGPDRWVVWGVERPELLITETLAAHSRRTEDLTVGNANGNANGNAQGNAMGNANNAPGQDNEFDQGLRPEPFAFIELYNPWTQNSLNQKLDPSLYNTATQGVQLDRLSDATFGDRSPVWRLSVDRPDRDGDDEVVDPESGPRRFVYFTDPNVDSDNIEDDDDPEVEVYYSERDNDWNAYQLRPGSQAIVGTLGFENGGEYRTFMGRLTKDPNNADPDANLDLDNTQHIQINPETGVIDRFPIAPSRSATIVPINKARRGNVAAAEDRTFSVSDPTGGYRDDDRLGLPMVAIDDGFRYQNPFNKPFDRNNSTDDNRNEEDLNRILIDDGISTNFREIKLQRLANPTRPWDEETNPYLTIDQLEMDLIAFNGVESQTETGLDPAQKESAASLERGVKNNNDNLSVFRDLWRRIRGGIGEIPAGVPIGGHAFEFQLDESIGKTNDAFVNNNGNADEAFTWLTWNNRPYVSHLELANVPFAEPDKLTLNFSTKRELDDFNPYNPDANNPEIRGRYQHLLNFFAFSPNPQSPTNAGLYRIMDYLEVPSRYPETRQYLNTEYYKEPFNFISRFRVPGKINLNTIYHEEVWNALQGGTGVDPNPGFGAYQGGLNWESFKASRRLEKNGMPTDFRNPYRPAGQMVNAPTADLAGIDEVGTTIFRDGTDRTDGVDVQIPLFDWNPQNPDSFLGMNPDRNAYFRNHQRQRLGNLVTTKSSVFAVWVTIGYFEVDANGRVGRELGSGEGDVRRNRGFFIFDRSIPMAFEPGKNHNIENGILVKSIIE